MKQIIQITPAAQTQIVQILDNHPDHVLQLGVNNKGCSGHTYTFELIAPDQIKPLDDVIDILHHKVVVSAASVFMLIGSTLDHETNKFGSRFVWHNPAVKNTCGCGESVGF
jgi:iron-sulfur cluster assembly accessory protein